ncbi:uncharacterized protein LOC115395214 isoform X2 [Salarias fasciatus]|uniref:uncharacterized protein LOC115395214 isoform X2 n=1 Tax=Salarias fasciatus TaxID=181472 RepID=UPI001176CC2A|nr:uncharacterized protein LOC115395214 isoform X2 [Salarias fasciatus]
MQHRGCETMISLCMVVMGLATMVLTKGSFECNFSEPNESHLCLGEEGQPLIFHLSNVTQSEIRLVKDGKFQVLKRELSGEVKSQEGYEFEIIDMGTFSLTNSRKNHSGNYMMQEFNSEGKLLKKTTMRVEISEMTSTPTSVTGPPGSSVPHVSSTLPGQTVVIIVSAVSLVLLMIFTVTLSTLQMKPRHPTINRRNSKTEVIYRNVSDYQRKRKQAEFKPETN